MPVSDTDLWPAIFAQGQLESGVRENHREKGHSGGDVCEAHLDEHHKMSGLVVTSMANPTSDPPLMTHRYPQ